MPAIPVGTVQSRVQTHTYLLVHTPPSCFTYVLLPENNSKTSARPGQQGGQLLGEDKNVICNWLQLALFLLHTFLPSHTLRMVKGSESSKSAIGIGCLGLTQ